MYISAFARYKRNHYQMFSPFFKDPEITGDHTRMRQTADIGLLVTSRPRGNACGSVWTLSAASNGRAYGFVAKDCPPTITGHEVGHLHGCCENIEEGCRNPAVPYAHGYQIPGTNKYTIMA